MPTKRCQCQCTTARTFFEAIDTAVTELKERFVESDGLKSYAQLETVLLCGIVDHAKQYPELSAAHLKLELAMFLRKYAVTRVSVQSWITSSSQLHFWSHRQDAVHCHIAKEIGGDACR